MFLTWKDVAHPMAGGSEVLAHRLATGLHDNGHEVTVISGGPVGEHPFRIVDAGGAHMQYLRDPYLARRHAPDADVVVDICNGIPFLSPLWTRKPVVALVNHVHFGMWDEWFSGPIAAVGRTIETKVMPVVYRRRHVVAVSQSTRDALVSIGVPADHISVVQNGVDPSPDAVREPRGPLTFAAIGRMVPHKRFDVLLRAWEQVRRELGEGVLEIAGVGPLREELERGAPPHTVFLGRVSEAEKHDLFSRAWCLIQPSRLEGWGLVVMEAAARGTPTLGFAVPGTRDAIDDGVSGVLVDDESSLIDSWLEVARDPGLRARLGKGALARAELFSWTKTVESFEAVLTRAIREPRPR